MALTYSTMLELGTKAPAFQLPDVVTGKSVSLDHFSKKKALLVMFICKHCPYVQHIKAEMSKLGKDYQNSELAIVAISTTMPTTIRTIRRQIWKKFSEELSLTYPLLHDESQQTAKAYTAACTPDFFLFDSQRKLVYRGQLDDSRPGNSLPVTGKDLRAAIDNALAGGTVGAQQKPSTGCNIKWKPGNEPKY